MKWIKKKASALALPLEETMRRDLLLFNNPVLMQGLALTPAVGATITLKNAIVLSVAVFLLVTPVRVFGDLLYNRLPSRLRMMVYALAAAALYIPVSWILSLLFGAQTYNPGLFLPLLVVDGVTLSRAEIPSREGTANAVRNGLMTALGVSAVLLVTGAVRELLGEGRIYGVQLFEAGPVPLASTVAGGFITIAVFAAVFQAAANRYKRARTGGEQP